MKMMKSLTPRGAILAFALFAAGLGAPAQGPLQVFADARNPANLDNHGELIVIQPSRHGAVTLEVLQTGPTGTQAIPVLGLNAHYERLNQSVGDGFVDLDLVTSLLLPNPVFPTTQTILAQAGIFVAGVFESTLGPIPFGGSATHETAFYYQCAAVHVIGLSPLALDVSWTNGVTVVQTEGLGQSIAPARDEMQAGAGTASAVGDFNGDGVDDLAVGVPGGSAGGVPRAGHVLLYLGVRRTSSNFGGLHPVPYILEEPRLMPGYHGIANSGPETQASFGTAIAAGNVDGELGDDLLVSAPNASAEPALPFHGEAWIFRRLVSSLSTLPLAPTLVIPDPTQVVAVVPPAFEAGARFGYRVALGDTNGDGLADAFLSAPFADHAGQVDSGVVYAYAGPPTLGMPLLPVQTIADLTPSSSDRFGGALRLADLDSDVGAELLVGVPGKSVGGIASAGQVVAIDSPTSLPTVAWTIPHPAPRFSAAFGCTIGSGDLDNDGTPEVAIAADEEVSGLPNAGCVRTFGLTASGPVLLALLTSPAPQANERFGRELIVEDLNADGISDFAVAAPGCNVNGNAFSGAVFVQFGYKNVVPTNPAWRSLVLKATDASSYQFFGSTLAVGDFADVQVMDLSVGVPGRSVGSIAGAGGISLHTDLLHRRDNRNLDAWLMGTPPNL